MSKNKYYNQNSFWGYAFRVRYLTCTKFELKAF